MSARTSLAFSAGFISGIAALSGFTQCVKVIVTVYDIDKDGQLCVRKTTGSRSSGPTIADRQRQLADDLKSRISR